MADMLHRLQQVLADRYRVLRELGAGGMATVYLAEDLKHDRPVALKVLRPELAASLGPDRFLREIAIVAKLAHPNILPLHDSGNADGLLYYVMPYVEGESLRGRLSREGMLPIEDALRIGEEVADALGQAHARGVIHRDIKPENILLEAGHAVVADFGIARAVSEAGGTRLTDTGLAVGTPSYMSPEQASGDRVVDARTDLYALGCVMYEMLSGEPPHTGPSSQAILARVLSEEVRPLRAARAAVPPAVDSVICKALSRVPADRFPTADALRTALRQAVASGVGPPGPEPFAAAPARSRTRRVLTAAGLATATVLGVVLVRGLTESVAAGDRRLGLAVFPFQPSHALAEQWSEQVPDLLATVLDGTPGVRVADPWSLWTGLRPERGARAVSPADLSDAANLARASGAAQFILGSIASDGAQLTLSVRLYRIGSPQPVHTLAFTGSADSLGALVQRLAIEIITRVRPAESARIPELEGYATRSADALKAYLRAKEAMRRGLVDLAEATIDTAITLDSTFALGLVEAVGIKSWAQFMRAQPFRGLLDLVEQAIRHGDSLSERNRLRLEATRASIRTEGPAAAAAARGILAIDSTDVDAWNLLAYYHLVYGWQYGAEPHDALAARERALRLDSTHVPNLVGMLWLTSNLAPDRERRYAELLRRTDTLSPLSRGALLGYRAHTAPDPEFQALADTLAEQGGPELLAVLRGLRATRPDRAEALLSRLRSRQGPGLPDFRLEWGRLLAARGRYGALDSALQAGAFAQQTVPRWFLVDPLLTGAGDSATARRAMTFLEPYVPADSAAHYFETRPVWVNGWTVAAYHAMFGDSMVTRRWQRAIGTLPAGGTPNDYRASLQADLDARLLARRGDLEAALGAARRALEQWGIHTENVPEFHPEPGMRFHYGMLLLATGRRDSAAALFRSLVPPTTWMGFLTARASLELGRLAEDRGDRPEAARHYATAYRLWQPAEPALAGWLAAARDGLRRVTEEPVAR